MMESAEIVKYCNLMEEVKQRVAVIDGLGLVVAAGDGPAIEQSYLQLRKILEIVAFGSLIYNRNVFAQTYRDFERCWNAKRLLKQLAKVNPGFYPRAVVQDAHGVGGAAPGWKPQTKDYLTQADFVALYNVAGGILHFPNPYNPKGQTDFRAAGSSVPLWRGKIVNLLSMHEIRLVNDPKLYTVQMKCQDGKVHATTWEPVNDQRTSTGP